MKQTGKTRAKIDEKKIEPILHSQSTPSICHSSFFIKYVISILLYLSWGAASFSQSDPRRFELRDITEGKYTASGISAMRPLPDGEHYTMLSADGKAILKYAYPTGKITDTLFHVDKTL